MIACFKVKVMGAIGPGIFRRVPTVRKVLNRDIALAAQFTLQSPRNLFGHKYD